MLSLTLVSCRIRAVVICCLSLVFAQSVHAQSVSNSSQGSVSAADLAKIQDSLNQMREFYEKRIDALESKLDKLEKQNSQLSQKVQSQSDVTASALKSSPPAVVGFSDRSAVTQPSEIVSPSSVSDAPP